MSTPTFLPLISSMTTRHGSRSVRTCEMKCASQCDHVDPNPSDNPHIQQVLREAVSRRAVLQAGAAGATALGLTGLAASSVAAAPRVGEPQARKPSNGLTFTSVAPNRLDEMVIPAGYHQGVVVSWGDPIHKDSPAFDVNAQTPEAQARQFGYNNDYTMVLPLHGSPHRSLLVCNHEYTDEYLMFPAGVHDEDTMRRVSMQACGMSVIEIERVGRTGRWQRLKKASRYNRRITATTRFDVTGPAAADPRVGDTAYGTFGNCSGGVTPWGTVLSGEENFHGYFDVTDTVPPEHHASYARYGVPTAKTEPPWYKWYSVDPRFDLSHTPTEAYRFGWVVEVDPYDPERRPRKRTMLGRLKHEGATSTLTADGRVAIYTGDDERGEYIYKFVSTGKHDPKNRRKNFALLDHGTLYVAKYTGDGTADGVYDGTGEWLPLTSDTESFVPGMSVADVLVNARMAADTVGATRMDRPEDIERNPVNNRIYAALTNNSRRGSSFPTDEANPIATSWVRDDYTGPLVEAAGNRNGYILEMTEEADDAARTTFFWTLFLVCGDPESQETYFGGYDKTKVSPISCPDNVTFDRRGNLWISTDGNALGANDGIFAVPVAGPERGRVRAFLTVPYAAEACGPLVSRDGKTVFVAVQHPGETDDATFEQPASTWPHTDHFPRPSIACVWRKDGKLAGT